MLLSEIIVERIKKDGPLSFKDFMEMALYYPQLGYYNSMNDKIGVHGDFYTSPYVSASFGAMIGRQMEEMWQILGKNPFTIVEYGAGTGLLCHDILDYLKNNSPLYDHLSYCIIEKSGGMQAIEKTHLHEKVSWYDCIKEIPEINGCILSNELIDNFSVHQVVMEDRLMEVFVDYTDTFIEILKPAKKELIEYFERLNIQLEKGFRTEVNLEALSWVKEISLYLNKGYVITIDYGADAAELYCNRRSCGTLLCYYKHHRNDNPYLYIGEQDITTHTNFSAIQLWGQQYGMDTLGLVKQADFLLGLGIIDYQNLFFQKNENNLQLASHHVIMNHKLLFDMGMKFKVLIQQKAVPTHSLSGLTFLNS
jgi:SAM-dependent MidA family methyltransferase